MKDVICEFHENAMIRQLVDLVSQKYNHQSCLTIALALNSGVTTFIQQDVQLVLVALLLLHSAWR